MTACVVLAGCTPTDGPLSSPTPVRSSTPTPTAPQPSATATPPPAPVLWTVGASPLPLRPDGFGQVLPTPRVLRDRRLPTTDVLAPPRDGRFRATVGPVTRALGERMGDTYRPGCPVPLSSLRYLTVTFRGFDGKAHTGEIVVAARVAPDVVGIFRTFFARGFPLEEMRLPTTADLTAKPTGDGNNTAGFVCRAARGQTRFSAHAYGVAIDVNPFHNPYVKSDLVLPELASAYVDRSRVRPGMLLRGSAPVQAFRDAAWTWGGDFRSLKDYQHFSLTGD